MRSLASPPSAPPRPPPPPPAPPSTPFPRPSPARSLLLSALRATSLAPAPLFATRARRPPENAKLTFFTRAFTRSRSRLQGVRAASPGRRAASARPARALRREIGKPRASAGLAPRARSLASPRRSRPADPHDRNGRENAATLGRRRSGASRSRERKLRAEASAGRGRGTEAGETRESGGRAGPGVSPGLPAPVPGRSALPPPSPRLRSGRFFRVAAPFCAARDRTMNRTRVRDVSLRGPLPGLFFFFHLPALSDRHSTPPPFPPFLRAGRSPGVVFLSSAPDASYRCAGGRTKTDRARARSERIEPLLWRPASTIRAPRPVPSLLPPQALRVSCTRPASAPCRGGRERTRFVPLS